jgi:hypothetical protein
MTDTDSRINSPATPVEVRVPPNNGSQSDAPQAARA